ncbi:MULTISPECIES: helix-turn-helix domain-containing protein [unclassified Methanoregula]|uniref:winged helix-turn-helix transcriptional regulator n=1 Tax=unclassified Methanoregula TaxID=2649730 RepID=UPI0009CC9BE2|nr:MULTISPECIES: helix-turn-helix domain-containing protein [unclassified Methanoregula]OPX64970.1 MAG: HxlR-like helix-turn-helix [Methanoregula sp. PtaB.Bin085]OPY35092.1 MAG: HxlR-like helix-turn-helix [Methanoregula sp. PtaU1.Bin006]
MKKPSDRDNDVCFCPLFGILDVVAKKWALLIIAILGNEGEKGFNELKKELGCIGPKPLSDTLKNLERIGLVKKQVLETSPPTVKYSLTPDGWEFRKHLIPMLLWVSERGGEEMPGCPIKAGNHE